MKFQLTLLLSCMLFFQVQSLLCQYCISAASVTCKNKEINCPDQCASFTYFEVKGGKNLTKVMKTCGMPELCSNESVNLGGVKMTLNAKCCNTTLCNADTLPVFPQQRANGNICYSCKNNDCSQTVDCMGTESQCISQTDTQLGKTLTMKGCANKAACSNSAIIHLQGGTIGSNQCCEGNLCNGAESFTLSFLLMLISLLSSTLFY